jgi:hypothetical protein
MTAINRTRFRRRALALLLFGLGVCGLVVAEPVSYNRASRAATNWLYMVTGSTYQPQQAVHDAAMAAVQQQPTYYVINMEPEGWVIVAGDDRAYPIVGYSTDGELPQYERPPAFEAWMGGVSDQIAAVSAQSDGLAMSAHAESASTAATIASAWNQLEDIEQAGGADGGAVASSASSVSPLIRTTWSQGRYYNRQCPVDSRGPDGRALVGCVATAMGQIMRYHAQPARGSGSHSYRHSTYGTLSANFGATNYAWSSMPSSAGLSSHNSAVATLLSHAGVAVDMDYGHDGSGALPSKVAPALRNYFGYRADNVVSRSSYTSAQWLQKLRTDLDNERPIFYVGYGSGGHAFVCDGYTSGSDYFHFNWGWGGYADGNYYLNNLTPGGSNFNSNQAAVFGIEPDGNGSGGALVDVLQSNYAAAVYDAYASYYGGLALMTGSATYRYYTYLYAYHAYSNAYQAYYRAPSGSATKTEAYSAFLYAYYRYIYAAYDYAYTGYGYYVLVYDFYGDLARARVNAEAGNGGSFSEVLQQAYTGSVYDAYASFYGGLALMTGSATYRYYAYIYARNAYSYAYQAYYRAPAGSSTESAAYSASVYAYYRYVYAYYDCAYRGYGNYVLAYDFYGDLYGAPISLRGAQGS